jgi:hypothetical protein
MGGDELLHTLHATLDLARVAMLAKEDERLPTAIAEKRAIHTRFVGSASTERVVVPERQSSNAGEVVAGDVIAEPIAFSSRMLRSDLHHAAEVGTLHA